MSRYNQSSGPSSHTQTYKIVVVGGGGVGKSAITIQFIQVSDDASLFKWNQRVYFSSHYSIATTKTSHCMCVRKCDKDEIDQRNERAREREKDTKNTETMNGNEIRHMPHGFGCYSELIRQREIEWEGVREGKRNTKNWLYIHIYLLAFQFTQRLCLRNAKDKTRSKELRRMVIAAAAVFLLNLVWINIEMCFNNNDSGKRYDEHLLRSCERVTYFAPKVVALPEWATAACMNQDHYTITVCRCDGGMPI